MPATASTAAPPRSDRTLPWVAPFAVFMAWIAVGPAMALPQPWESLLRVGVLAAVLAFCSRDLIRGLRVRRPWQSIALGLAVFALWIAPDQLIPGWRSHALFQNAITGQIVTSIPAADLASPLVVTLRLVRAALLVPFLEEFFWRGWLPRWLISSQWASVPMGRYTPLAFVGTALLFASEHGPYWDVGLLCGLLYNGWMWRTQSLGDLVLVHAVTNAALGAFVLVTGQYAYWM